MSGKDDPFGANGRTVIRPTPGGVPRPGGAPKVVHPQNQQCRRVPLRFHPYHRLELPWFPTECRGQHLLQGREQDPGTV